MAEVKNLKEVEELLFAWHRYQVFGRPHMTAQIPTDRFDAFKELVMSTYFGGEYPLLTKHNMESDSGYTLATFSSDDMHDVPMILDLLPDNSYYWV